MVQRSEDGNGKIAYQNGDKYKGQWQNGLQHGKGTYVFSTETVMKENGKMGRLEFHGEGIYFYSDGSMRAGQWTNGTLIEQ